jgi:transcriptional regulator with XRE-family HTH domain
MARPSNLETLTLEQAIGGVIRRLRMENGLKQIEVAVATGFAVTTLRKMESGKQSMTIRSLDALAMFYCLPIEELIIRAKRMRTNPNA